MIINPFLYGGQQLPELDNPGTAPDLLAGKQLIDQQGKALTGTMPQRSSGDLTASGATVTVPAGHYPSGVSKTIASAGTITGDLGVTGGASWNSNGINGSGTVSIKNVNQTAGYTSGYTNGTLTVRVPANRLLKGRTVTPTTAEQTIANAEDIAYGAIKVAGDANLKAANIKSGVSIFGVAGSFAGAQIKKKAITKDMVSFEAGNGFKITHGINRENIISIAFNAVLINGGSYYAFIAGGPSADQQYSYPNYTRIMAAFQINGGSGGETALETYSGGYSYLTVTTIPSPGAAVSFLSLSGCICYV